MCKQLGYTSLGLQRIYNGSGQSIAHDPDRGIQPALEQWFLQFLRMKQTILSHQEVVEYTHLGARKSD